jgi:replicative DNA helicase
MQIRAMARRLQSQQKQLGLIVIDYLQLIHGPDDSESRVQEVSEISRALKALAKELNIPVLAISQLSRAVEMRQDAVPKLSDLRESGSIEQDADVVMFIYRPDLVKKNVDKKNVAEIHIAKHRNGPTGIIELGFDENSVSFYNLAKNFDEEPF